MAARVAGKRFLGLELDRGEHAAELRTALGGLKGPLMKVAQILSTVPDVLSPEYTTELAQLQTNAPAMGWPFVKRRMAGELGADWPSRFSAFERDAVAAASLGQVHRAVGQDGSALACKLQYPDMRSTVEADLSQLKLAFSIYRRYDNAIDPSQIHAELSARLREELDYDREAANMRLYGRMLEGEPDVFVPEARDDLSTARLLTMSWMDGDPLLALVDHAVEKRNAVARNMFRAWYVPFYYYGVLHGDPHLGNYTVRPDGSINLFDFGCVRVFKPSFVGGVIDLYKALRDGDEALAVSAYETWGFQNPRREVIDILNQWARFLYAPVLDEGTRSLQETHAARQGAHVAAKVHRELRRFGGITPPREFVLMDRAAIGLGSVFVHLRAEINWHRMFHDLIDDFDEAAMRERQDRALREAGISALE
jgi:predicted unusual protein kinase regulating ubiquinone biosynthesis (AarF/ABC1/UbiB family)